MDSRCPSDERTRRSGKSECLSFATFHAHQQRTTFGPARVVIHANDLIEANLHSVRHVDKLRNQAAAAIEDREHARDSGGLLNCGFERAALQRQTKCEAIEV